MMSRLFPKLIVRKVGKKVFEEKENLDRKQKS